MLLLSACSLAFSQSNLFHGEAAISNITPEEARNRAIRQARLAAIEQSCGVQMQSESVVKDFMLSGDFIRSLSWGHIVDEKIVQETVLINQQASDQPPRLTYHLSMQMEVRCERGQPDPAFQLTLKSNKSTFIQGDNLVLTVRSTLDCYLTLVDFSPDGQVYILTPSPFLPDNRVTALTDVEIPASAVRQAGIRLRLGLPAGATSASEVILAIATKTKVPFLDAQIEKSGLGKLDNIIIAGTQLMRWLSEIPVSERAEAQVMVTVNER